MPAGPASARARPRLGGLIEDIDRERPEENERRRLARELHDEVGQTLTGAVLQLEGLHSAAPDASRPSRSPCARRSSSPCSTLGMRDRVELTRWAIRHGLVEP